METAWPPIALRPDVWTWLAELQAVTEEEGSPAETGDFSVHQDFLEEWFNGRKLSKVLYLLGEEKGVNSSFSYVNQPTTKFSPTAFRVYQWSYVAEDLGKWDISLDAELRAMLVDCNAQVVLDILDQLYGKCQSTLVPSPPTEDLSEAPVALPQSESPPGSVELAECLAEHLRCPVEKAAAYVQDPASLRTVFVCGVDGEHAPIEAWLKYLYAMLETFPMDDSGFCNRFLDLITSGLSSPEPEVVRWACRILIAFPLKDGFCDDAYTWFCKSCFSEVVRCIKLPNQEHLAYLTATMLHFSSGNLEDLFMNKLPKLILDSESQLRFLGKVVTHLRQSLTNEPSQLQLAVKLMLSLGLRCLAGVKESEIQEALQFLIHIWTEYPDNVAVLEEESEKVITELRKKCRQQSASTKICCILCMFRLLEVLMTRKNVLAPQIYKCLVFLMIESNGEQQVRDLITANFSYVMKRIHALPPQVVIEPLVREISLEGYSNLDIEFISTISNHPRLPVKYALLLAHMLGKIAINDPVFARLAMMPFLTLIARFHATPLMQDYVEKYCKVAVSMFLKSVERIYTSCGVEDGIDTNKIRQELSLEVVHKICQLKIGVYTERMAPSVRCVCEEYSRIYQQEYPPLQKIAALLGQQLSTLPAARREHISSASSVHTETIPEGVCATPMQSLAHIEFLPEKTETLASESQTDTRARQLLHDNFMEEEVEMEARLLEPAVEEQKKISQLQQRHAEELEFLRQREAQLLREQELAAHQKRAELNQIRMQEKALEEEKYKSMERYTKSPEFVPAKVVKRKKPRRMVQKHKIRDRGYSQPKSARQKLKEKHRFLSPWPQDVKKFITVTYHLPFSRIFKLFKGKKPRSQRFGSFDEVAKAKKSMCTADFLAAYEALSVAPTLLPKPEMLHLCKEVSDSGGQMVTFKEFLMSVWFVALTAYREESISGVAKVQKLLQYMQEESAYSTVLPKDLWRLEKRKRRVKKNRIPSLSPPLSPTFSQTSTGTKTRNQILEKRERAQKEKQKIEKIREQKRRARDRHIKKKLQKKKLKKQEEEKRKLKQAHEQFLQQQEEKRRQELQFQRRQSQNRQKIKLHQLSHSRHSSGLDGFEL